jgi:hypothetical protein
MAPEGNRQLPADVRIQGSYDGRGFADGVRHRFSRGRTGIYVGSIFSSGDVGKLSPEDGEVIVLGPGDMERVSLQKFGAELLEFLDNAKQAAASLSEPPSDDEPSSSA